MECCIATQRCHKDRQHKSAQNPLENKTDNRSTAYHEAGHAVAAYSMGLPFQYVTIVPAPSQDSLGHVRYFTLPKWFHPESDADEVHVEILLAFAIAAFAGPVAEERFSGSNNDVGAGSDHRQIADIFIGFGPDYQRRIDEAQSRTESLVNEHWSAIEVLAKILLKRRRIHSTEAKQIIARALPRRLTDAANKKATTLRQLKLRKAYAARQRWIFVQILKVHTKEMTLDKLASKVFSVKPTQVTKTQYRDLKRVLKHMKPLK